MDTLERQVEVASQELGEYKRKCQVIYLLINSRFLRLFTIVQFLQDLEKENATLMVQLKSLRAMVLSSATKEQIKIKLEPPSEGDF